MKCLEKSIRTSLAGDTSRVRQNFNFMLWVHARRLKWNVVK